MGAPVVRILPVYKAERGFPVVVAVRQCKFERRSFQCDDRIDLVLADLTFQQILQPVARQIELAIQIDREPAVQIGVHPEPFFEVLRLERVTRKQFRIRSERHERPIALRGFSLLFALQDAAFEPGLVELPVAIRTNRELLRQRIHRLGSDTVEPDGEGERPPLIFAACIHFRNTRHNFVERNSAPIVANGDASGVQRDLDALADPHREFIDAVVDDLLDKHVNSVLGMASITETADVHAGAKADMLQRQQRFNRAAVILRRRFRHLLFSSLCPFNHNGVIYHFSLKMQASPGKCRFHKAGKTERNQRVSGATATLSLQTVAPVDESVREQRRRFRSMRARSR